MTVTPADAPRSRFLRGAFVFFAFLVLLQNWPVLLNRVPLPMDIVFTFPPWSPYVDAKLASVQHAELGDLVTEFYPWRAFTTRAVQHRILPLWNPYSFLGTPFQATPLNALFYPLIILYYLLPASVAWTLSWLIRPLIAGVLAAWFGRTIRMTRSAALLTGVCYAFSSFMVVWQGWPQVDTAMWLPLVFVMTEKLRQAPNIRHALGLAVACALTFLGGHPGIALYIVLAAALYAIYRLIVTEAEAEKSNRIRVIVFGIAAAVITIGITAVQLLPMLEWVRQTYRSPEESRSWYLPATKAVGFLCRDIDRTQNYAGLDIPEQATYAGIVALVLGFMALAGRQKRMAAIFLLLAIFSTQIIFGWGPGYWFSSRAPALKAFNNIRFIVIWCFAVAVLAGIGLTFLQEHARELSKKAAAWWWVCWAAAALAGAYGIVKLYSIANAAVVKRVFPIDGPAASAALLVAALLLTCPFIARRWRSAAGALFLLGALDLVTFAYRHMPYVSPRYVFPRPPVFRLLKEKDASLYRVLSIDGTLPSNAELMYGFSSPTGYEFPLARTHRILEVFAEGETALNTTSKQLLRNRTRVLDMMNVKYLIGNSFNNSADVLSADPGRFRTLFQHGPVSVIENLTVLPRAFLLPAEAAVVVRSGEEALQRITSSDFDPARQAIVEPAGKRISTPPLRAGTAEERLVIRSGINATTIDAAVPRASLLVLNDAFYPGWHVYVDGKKRDLLRVNYAFQGVFVEAGQHTIAFRYRPMSFFAGLAITAFTLLVIVAGAWLRSRATSVPRLRPADRPSPAA